MPYKKKVTVQDDFVFDEQDIISSGSDISELSGPDQIYRRAKENKDYVLVFELTSQMNLKYTALKYLKPKEIRQTDEERAKQALRILRSFIKSFAKLYESDYLVEYNMPNELLKDNQSLFPALTLGNLINDAKQVRGIPIQGNDFNSLYPSTMFSYGGPKYYVIMRVKRQTTPPLFMWPLCKLTRYLDSLALTNGIILIDTSREEEKEETNLLWSLKSKYRSAVVGGEYNSLQMFLSLMFELETEEKFKQLDMIEKRLKSCAPEDNEIHAISEAEEMMQKKNLMQR